MPNDNVLIDWIDAEMPVMFERDGEAVIVVDSDTGVEVGRGANVREAVWNAMRAGAV